MTGSELALYLGRAALLALLTAPLLALALARLSGRPLSRSLGLTLPVLFFLALAFLPLPGPEFDCATMAKPALYLPGSFPHAMFKLWQRGVPPLEWLLNRSTGSAAMNLLLCLGIGLALARFGLLRTRTALVFGACLSLGIELSQLTGFWGLYPCAWRQFDTDDLILNIGGILLGHRIGCKRVERQGGGLPLSVSRR